MAGQMSREQYRKQQEEERQQQQLRKQQVNSQLNHLQSNDSPISQKAENIIVNVSVATIIIGGIAGGIYFALSKLPF